MKKKNIIRSLTFLSLFGLLVYITNFTDLKIFFIRVIEFSNYNGTYYYYQNRLKGETDSQRSKSYAHFLSQNSNIEDKQLYRRFRMDLWRFWEWSDFYYFSDQYKLPYISEKEINENRKREGLPPIVFD
ncbi:MULTISPECIES: hypothetical protein [Sphingobacterium]|uniref:hypothetical protein n=1 Tax=Sphingobacterium TaxID=28453 RepID=UPI0013DB71B8|nr:MULTISPECIES: hypothetical protein [unclassified Sphingobacterium]